MRYYYVALCVIFLTSIGVNNILVIRAAGVITTQGTNVTITGAGTVAGPYVVNAIVPQQDIDEFTATIAQTD